MIFDPSVTFAGRNVVLTGASSGIGAALAMALVAAGATVYTATTRAARLSSLEAAGIRGFRADLGDAPSLEEWINHLKTSIDRLHALIHCAAVICLGTIEDSPVNDLERQFAVNVRAPYRLTQALMPLLEMDQGQVIFVNSSAGVNARANTGQYSATKFALRAIADALRGEVNQRGIRVMTIYPGRTATPMQQAVFAAEDKEWNPSALLQPSDVAATILQTMCLPHTAEVTDLHIRPMHHI